MKTLITLLILVISAGTINGQAYQYNLTSGQHQEVKYDSTNKVYFIEREINHTSNISIEGNIITFVDENNAKTRAFINNLNIESLSNKESFSMTGRDVYSGKKVTLNFWFIGDVLDEVSYANEAMDHNIAYKDLSEIHESSAQTISAHFNLKQSE